MPDPFTNRVRVTGSGFTIISFAGQPIAFAQQFAEQSPTPVGQGPVAVHPMDEPYPVQVLTPAAASMGSITLRLWELYNQKVWDRLAANVNGKPASPFGGAQSNNINTAGGLFEGAIDIVDVFIRQAEYPRELSVTKFIRPPTIGGRPGRPYAEQYHGCVITNIDDGEQVSVDTMEVLKTVTIAYLFKSRGGRLSRAFSYRNRAIG
jgi:hypothetical protein